MQIDFENKWLKIGVRELLYEESTGSDLGSGGLKRVRAAAGREAHQLLQDERCGRLKTYRSEVHIKYESTIDGFQVLIQGRIDGVYEHAGSFVIEEIKSTMSLDEVEHLVASGALEAYVMQLKLYLYLLSSQSGRPCRGYLVFVDVVDHDQKRIEIEADYDAVGELIETRVRSILEEFRGREKDFQQKREKAQELAFPFAAPRKFQTEMMDEVTGVLERKEDALFSAPTGVGKTVGALFPAVKYALENRLRLFFVTSKTTQQKLVIDTLKMIDNGSGYLKAINLRAKEKMCPNDEYHCHPDFCRYSRGYFNRMSESSAVGDLLRLGVVTPEDVFERGMHEELCPFELSLDISLGVDVVVCDYNYVFDPAVYLKRFFSDRYDDIILIIDEAHNLYSRGRDYFSPKIERGMLKKLFERIPEDTDPVFDQARELLGSIDDYLDELKREGAGPGAEKEFLVGPDVDFFVETREVFDLLMMQYQVYKKEHKIVLKDDLLADFYFDFCAFVNVLLLEGDEFTYIYCADRGREYFKILCMDPSGKLGQRIKGFYSTIAMSATLEPAEFYRNVLGFDPDNTLVERFPSPFPPQNRKILVLPHISTIYRHRSDSVDKLGELIGGIVRARAGNYFVFFPSFDYMLSVVPYLDPGDYELLLQQRSMTEHDRYRLLKKLSKKEKKHLVLAVQSGIFAEGVDYPGEMLIGVIIVGPGLPRYCFEQELMKQYYDQKIGKGFEYAYLYPGMNRVVQSAGRVIRTEHDRGIVALIGRRFAGRQYAQLLPPDWYQKSPRELIANDYEQELNQFWNEGSPQ